MKKLLVLYLFISTILFFPLKVHAKTAIPDNLSCDGYVLMDMDSGKILASKNENTRYEPASITKVLTALIVIEKGNLSDKITITKTPTAEEGSSIYLKEGEVMTVEQLLYGLMLKSGNDAATALAQYISGSNEEFAKEMNKKAKELGATNSNFTNPHGLNDNNHYTTPRDYAIISKGAMQNPTFRKIVSTVRYEIPATPQFPEVRCFINHNKLISTKKYKYEGANGIKTGFTTRSLHTFVGSATKGDTNLLIVLLKSTNDFYNTSKLLLDYGFNNYESKYVINKDEPIGNMELEGKSHIKLLPDKSFKYIFEKDNPEKLTQQVDYLNIKSFKKGDVVAKLNIISNGNIINTIDLKADKEYKTKLEETLSSIGVTNQKQFIIFVSSAVAVLILALTILNIKVRKVKRK